MADVFKSYRTGSGKSISALLSQYGERAEKSLGAQLYREAQGIMASSQGLVPVDTGALRSSGYVKEPEREGDQVVVTLGYGGPAAKINPKSGESTDGYAIHVHENLDAVHKVGTAKFLELPFDQAKSGMAGRIANNIRADLHGMGGFTAGSAEGGASLEPEGGLGL